MRRYLFWLKIKILHYLYSELNGITTGIVPESTLRKEKQKAREWKTIAWRFESILGRLAEHRLMHYTYLNLVI